MQWRRPDGNQRLPDRDADRRGGRVSRRRWCRSRTSRRRTRCP